MKTHAIIPIFLPELGCPKQCVFCNQQHISGQRQVPGFGEVRETIEQYLGTMQGKQQVELAFFGGSFTALPMELQESYLQIATPYLESKQISNIRLSTRPDAITDQNLLLLKQYGVSIIELGVQSLDDEVLRLSGRGYSASVVYKAVEKIVAQDFTLGMQLMIGLPCSSHEKDMFTAKEIIRCGAKGTRIYPLLVFRDTDLEQLYNNGKYTPLSVEEAIEQSADILELFLNAGVQVYKIGLHPSEFLENGTLLAGPWIPAFRQHVQARVWKRKFEKMIHNNNSIKGFVVHPSDINSALGPNRCNAAHFTQKGLSLLFRTDAALKRGEFYAFYS